MALSHKQKAFIDAYLQCWNAAEAARQAGYSEKTARNIGHENLTKPDISEEIQRRVNERAMSANEALLLLAEHARSDMGEYISDEGEIDISAMKEAKATKLLRKVKFTKRIGESKDGGTWEHTTVEAELYSAQSALELIGKTHKLFTEKMEHSGATVMRVIYDSDDGDSNRTDDPAA